MHLWLGLISGIVVVIVSITGALYVFEEEARNIFQRKYYHVAKPGVQRQTIEQLGAGVQKAYPDEKITSVRMFEREDGTYIFTTKTSKAISVDPYTGAVIGHRNLKTDFFSVVLDIHRHLAMGKVGGEIVKWNVLIFFILCISGLVLWWPKQKRFWKQATRINFKTKNWKRFNWDLHSVLGFYALLVLFLISLTGLFFAFDTTRNVVRFLTNQPQPKKEEKLASRPDGEQKFTPDQAYRYTSSSYPGSYETIVFIPADSAAALRVLSRYPYAVVARLNNIYFDQYSGKLLRANLYSNYTAYDKVSRSNYDFHTGRIRVLGLGSKIIYFLVSMIAASLPVTGFLIWLGRKKKKKAQSPAIKRYRFLRRREIGPVEALS